MYSLGACIMQNKNKTFLRELGIYGKCEKSGDHRLRICGLVHRLQSDAAGALF